LSWIPLWACCCVGLAGMQAERTRSSGLSIFYSLQLPSIITRFWKASQHTKQDKDTHTYTHTHTHTHTLTRTKDKTKTHSSLSFPHFLWLLYPKKY
jgi:hypothetical protein